MAAHAGAAPLAAWPAVQTSLPVVAQSFVDFLRKLMPRLYSIASSSKVYPNEVHLTVAIVRYETNHRARVGVATTFLADRVQAHTTPVPVFVSHSHFGVPDDGADTAEASA